MSRTPATREELFQIIADAIGWGVTADAVADVAAEIEAKGVRFIPDSVVPASIMKLNPYAPPKPKP